MAIRIQGWKLKSPMLSETVYRPTRKGDLLCGGSYLFGSYCKRPEFNDFTADGWFRTGDRARIDVDGYVRITGRSKDIVIRGRENIPVAEVENALFTHPKIVEATIVAMPDPRLQERACAYVVYLSIEK